MGAKVGAGELKKTGMTMRCRFLAAAQDELFLDTTPSHLFDSYAQAGATPVSGLGIGPSGRTPITAVGCTS